MSKATQIPDEVKFVFSALTHAQEIKINFNNVAQDHGISIPNNARAKFRNTLKGYGFKFEGDKLTQDEGAAATPATPKSSPKRERSTKNGDDAETPTKKGKARKNVVKKGNAPNADRSGADDDEA